MRVPQRGPGGSGAFRGGLARISRRFREGGSEGSAMIPQRGPAGSGRSAGGWQGFREGSARVVARVL